MAKLLNLHRFHSSKKNKDFCIIQVLESPTSRQISQGYVGNFICQDIFLPDELVNVLSEKDIEKDIELVYEVSCGNASLVDIRKEK